jgi:hypothetical protein
MVHVSLVTVDLSSNTKRKDELWDAILKSEKSYEEILGFISADASEQEE